MRDMPISARTIKTGNPGADELLSGQELYCRSIVLSQGEVDNPCVITGAGYLKQDSTGRIHYKVFGPKFDGCPEREQVGPIILPGQAYSASNLFRLAAEDCYGHLWIAERVHLPDLQRFIAGELREIRATSNLDNHEPAEAIDTSDLTGSISLHFDGNANIGFNSLTTRYSNIRRVPDQREPSRDEFSFDGGELNVLRFSRDAADIDIVQEVGYFSVYVTPRAKLEPNFHVRIQEALQFVLGFTPLCRSITMLSHGLHETRVFSSREDLGGTLLNPPLDGRQYCNHDGKFTILLINKYVDCISRSLSDDWHSLSVRMHHAIAAGASSVEAFVLGLAVAIEGICDQLFPDLASPSEDYALAVDSLRAHIEEWPGLSSDDEQFREFATSIVEGVRGTLGHYKSSGAPKRMQALVKDGHISKKHVKAWKRARNMFVHGLNSGLPHFQQLADLWHSMTVLLYQMIFLAIGYDGPYIDYSEHGFPVKMYPERRDAES